MSDSWLMSLKEGDEVLVRNSASRGPGAIRTVERTTKTMVRVVGTNFNRETGRQCGTSGSYHWATLHKPTQKDKDEIRLVALRKKVEQIDPSLLTADQCAAIMEITTRTQE